MRNCSRSVSYLSSFPVDDAGKYQGMKSAPYPGPVPCPCRVQIVAFLEKPLRDNGLLIYFYGE